MAHIMMYPCDVGEIVNFKTSKGWITGIIMNIRAPLGFRQFDVIEMDTGKPFTVSRHQLEKVQLNLGLADDISENDHQPLTQREPSVPSHQVD